MKLKWFFVSIIVILGLFGFSSGANASDAGVTLQVNSSSVYSEDVIPARCEGACYKNIQDAVSAAESGDTILLTGDLVQESAVNDGWGVKIVLSEITLDLNGHTFKDNKDNGAVFKITENAGLIVKNSGDSETGRIQTSSGKTCITVQEGGKLTLLSGEIKNTRSIGKVVENNGTVKMYGGKISGSGIGIVNQSDLEDSDGILIYDGIISSEKNHGISMSSGECTVYGGRIKCGTGKSCINVSNESLCKVQIKGGVFNMDVSDRCQEGEYICCVNDHEETAEVYPWKVVPEKQIAVEAVCATIDDDGGVDLSENFGDVLGSGTYCAGDRIVLTAPVKSGWQFSGWFQKKGDTWTALSQEMPYACVLAPEENCLIAAGYVQSEVSTVTVHVTGSRFTIAGTCSQDGTYDADRDFECPFGSEITLASENEDSFQYWLNESNKIVSKNRQYTFTAVRNMTIQESRLNLEDQKTGLKFFSAYRQLLRDTNETGLSAICFPSIRPTGAGRIFTQWVFSDNNETADADNVLARIQSLHPKNMNILSETASNGSTCNITLVYDQLRDTETYADQTTGEMIAVTPDSNHYPDGKKFAYWTDSEGEILCFSETFRMCALADRSLAVKCMDEGENAAAVPVFNWQETASDENNGTVTFRLTTMRTVPEDFQVVDHGILYAGNAGQSLTLSDEQTGKMISSDLSRNGSFIGELYEDSGTYDAIFCRGFLVLRKGEAFYILYTDIRHIA